MTFSPKGPKLSPEDAAGLAKEDAQKAQREAARDGMKELKADLKRQEAKEFSGGDPLEHRNAMLDATPLEEANPDKHYRYLNTANKDRMPSRIHKEGYKPVPEEEAGEANVNARLGNLRLSEQPRKVFDDRVKAQEAETDRRLRAHVDSMERMAESVAKQLKDKHGISVDPGRLLVNE